MIDFKISVHQVPVIVSAPENVNEGVFWIKKNTALTHEKHITDTGRTRL